MSVWIVLKVLASVFALSYGVYATVFPFKEEHSGSKRLSRRGKWGIGLLILSSVVALLADVGDRTSAASQKARDQRSQEAHTAEQLRRLSGLASGLQSAQGTTAAISSDMQAALHELTRNTRSVSKVLTQSERALEPLKNLYFRGSIRLPESDSEISEFIATVKKAAAVRQGDILLEDGVRRMWEAPGVPGFSLQFDKLRAPPTLTHFMVVKGSPLYPKVGSGLAVVAQSILMVLHFSSNKFDPSNFIPSQFRKPDLALEFVATPDDVANSVGFTPDGTPILSFAATVPYSNWVSDGAILSVRDLLRAQAVIQPIFGLVKPSDEKALEIWKSITINYLTMSTGDGRWFRFHNKSTVRPDGIPVFVGRFLEGK